MKLNSNTVLEGLELRDTPVCEAGAAGHNLLQMSCADVSTIFPCESDTAEALFCLSARITWKGLLIY